jgi:DnaJ-domain-containing protein 1
MGQLFNRLRNFAKTQFKDYETSSDYSHLIDEDDDLKKQIDDASGKTGEFRSQKASSNASGKIDNELQALSILGLKPGVSVSDIKNAYKSMMKKFHPDRTTTMNEKDRKDAEKMTILINSAYEFLEKSRNF